MGLKHPINNIYIGRQCWCSLSPCDDIVVGAIMARNDLNHILVDNGSSVNILFGDAHNKMLIGHPPDCSLCVFTGDNVVPRKGLH